MIAADILLDGLFAAIAAIGFGAVSDPPMRAFPRIALLAAMGHALRFCLMHYFSVDIAILPQRNRIAERDRTAGSGGYAAHLRIQPPGILAHAAPQAYRQITIHGNLLEHHRLL